MQNAVVVFTKVPKAGETKTRLTIDRGGIFTPEEAKEFYEACLLDVIDSCIASRCCDVYICQNEGGDSEYLQKIISTLAEPNEIKAIFKDQGGTFDQGMRYAADYILRNGQLDRLADSVFIVGGDSPCLQASNIREAVKKLEELAASEKGLACAKTISDSAPRIGAGIVESIDQEGGFNLIGYTCATPFDFNGVFYNQDGITALDMIVVKAAEHQIPISLIEMIPDIDLPGDLASLIPVLNTLRIVEKFDSNYILPKRTDKILLDFGITTIAPVPGK